MKTLAPVAPPKARLTLNDVARAMGVSRTTVSNAFNRPEQLSAALREGVLGKARELGYFGPDPAARAMRRGGIHDVGVVFHHDLRYTLGDPLSLAFLRGVAKELDARQLNLQLIPKMGRREQLAAAFQATADALIVLAEIEPELAPQVEAAHKPLVLVDAFFAGATMVSVQDRAGARMAMAHALASAPARVLVLGFPLKGSERERILKRKTAPRSLYVAGERLAGYVAEVRARGFAMEQVTWIEVDERDPESAAERIAQWRGELVKGTRLAIVAMSDRMALAAQQQVAAWTGVTVSAIVGFDDGPTAEAAGLTTIRQDAFHKGELAVQALLDGVRPAPLAVELVVRKT